MLQSEAGVLADCYLTRQAPAQGVKQRHVQVLRLLKTVSKLLSAHWTVFVLSEQRFLTDWPVCAGIAQRLAQGNTAPTIAPSSSAAHAALARSAAAPPALSAVAAIGTNSSCGQQPGSYGAHPAVLDAMTHTAAVFSGSTAMYPDAQDSSLQPAVTRIPVALDAFLAVQPAAGSGKQDDDAGSWKWCSGALEALRPDDSVVTSFGLGVGAARLAGFQAKVQIDMMFIMCFCTGQ